MGKRKKQQWALIQCVWTHKLQDGLTFRYLHFATLQLPGGTEVHVEISESEFKAVINS